MHFLEPISVLKMGNQNSSERQRVEERISSLEGQVDSLKSKLKEKDEVIERREREIDDLIEKLETTHAGQNETIQKLRERLEKEQLINEDLQERLDHQVAISEGIDFKTDPLKTSSIKNHVESTFWSWESPGRMDFIDHRVYNVHSVRVEVTSQFAKVFETDTEVTS